MASQVCSLLLQLPFSSSPPSHHETSEKTKEFTLLKEEAKSSSNSSHNQMLKGAVMPEQTHSQSLRLHFSLTGPEGTTLEVAAPLPHPCH